MITKRWLPNSPLGYKYDVPSFIERTVQVIGAFFYGAVVLLFVAAVLLGTIKAARSHDWYPIQCCGGHDCLQLPDADVKEVPHGYMVRGTFVDETKALPSPDEHFHGCFPQGQLGCFWAPRKSV